MSIQAWLIPTVTAVSLILGMAGSLLTWFASRNRRARWDRNVERRFDELTQRLLALDARLSRFEEIAKTASADAESGLSRNPRPRWTGPSWPTTGTQQRHDLAGTVGVGGEPPLIAVPNLAAAANDRDVAVSGLTQRYAAIWSLAASGSSAEVIARATGQPIGQIELILGLRRQIDGTRTTIPHAPHS